MKTSRKSIWILITTLSFVLGQVSLALARGGGGKGGSLGGSLGGSSGGSFSGGGFGGLSGTGGFFPLPFFFFGGSSVGGGSILSLLFMLIILYLIFKALRFSRGSNRRNYSRRKNRGFGQTYTKVPDLQKKDKFINFSNDQPVDLEGRPITNSTNLQRFAKAISFTRENINYYAETFPRWDRSYLLGRVRQVFFWLQDAWSRQDLSEADVYLTPSLKSKYESDLTAMLARGERNMIKEPVLNPEDLEFIHCHLTEGDEHIIAMISASLIDYTVDRSGRLLSGDDRHRLYFTEFWEFVWHGNYWLLDKIYQEDSLELAKIARGDEL